MTIEKSTSVINIQTIESMFTRGSVKVLNLAREIGFVARGKIFNFFFRIEEQKKVVIRWCLSPLLIFYSVFILPL